MLTYFPFNIRIVTETKVESYRSASINMKGHSKKNDHTDINKDK